MTEATNEVIPQGPGAADYGDGWGSGYGWRSADSSLELEYLGVTKRATVAELTLVTTHIEGDDERDAPLQVSIELTMDDLLAIAGKAQAMASAAKEDGAQ